MLDASWKLIEKEAAAVLGGKAPVTIPSEIATPADATFVIGCYLTGCGHPEQILIVTETVLGTRIERSPEWERISADWRRHLARERMKDRLVKLLIWAWATASVAVTVIVIVVRVTSGPIDRFWEGLWVMVLVAPMWLALLGLVAGWIWFLLWLPMWLLARPFPQLRELRFMHPNRW